MSSQRYSSVSNRSARASKRLRRRRINAAAIVVVILVGAAILHYIFSSPLAGVQFASTQERDALATGLQSRVHDFTGSSRAVLEVTDREANAYIQSSTQIQSELRRNNIENPTIAFTNGGVTASAEIPVAGARMPVTVSGTFVASNNNSVGFKVDSVQIGRMNAPGGVTAQVASKIESMVNRAMSSLPSHVSSAHVENSRVVIVGE